MAQLGGGTFEEDILARRLTDLGQATGILVDRIKFGPAAGRYVTLRPGAGIWKQLNARTDLLAVPGAEVNVLDVPTAFVSGRAQKIGSKWRVTDPVDSSDPPVGILEPMAPIQLLQNMGPIVNAASGTFQIFSILGATPTQAQMPAGLLNSKRRRIRLRWLLTKAGATDGLRMGLFFGNTGTTASDTQIFDSGALVAATRTYDAVVEIARIDSTHIRIYPRTGTTGTVAFAGSNVLVPDMDATPIFITAAAKTGATDASTWEDLGIELT